VIFINTELKQKKPKGSKMKIKRNIIALPAAAMFLFAIHAEARENGANGHRSSSPGSTQRVTAQDQLAASCTPASAKTDLDINNVRTTIMTGGDMWYDLVTARYEVPKGGGAHSIFAGSLWIGGLDAGGQLKVAAMTYRQTGNDFWPGPLDTTSVSIDGAVCNAFDRHWKIDRDQVEDFVAFTEGNAPAGYSVPLVIQTWPGNGDASMGQGKYLAPFVDVDGDQVYNWGSGDYPAFNIAGDLGCTKFQLFGDQCLWWVFNDKGNVHSETGAAAIGLEIHAQAFGFETNDEINNMTFYTYKIINRSTVAMENTYFAQWCDADLGAYDDDLVGCDVPRGLGYTYNGDANDGSSAQPTLGTYGANPPAIGIDFFEGPMADAGDGIDNDRDGLTDEPGELIIMSSFLFYNNDFSVTGNPENATHYYNYLTGFWKDGSPFTYGGTGYGGTVGYNFMFPGNTDPSVTPWYDSGPADRRQLSSAGAFTLQPGAINYVTVGAVWARAASGGPMASVELMRATDDKAQRLFDNCFRTLDGPDAPDLTIQEMDKELIVYITNEPTSNNYLERYEAYDPAIVYGSVIGPGTDTTYNFEGYQIFQLKDNTVTTGDLYNLDKARLVAQFDLRNGVTTLVNREFDQALGADVPRNMTISADDKGISHSFNITEDAFASGDRGLVNHKTYYFMAITYAHNNYLTYDDVSFDPLNPTNPSNIGQKKPYLAGRRNVKIYSGIPHITSPEAGGTDQNANYNSGPKLTRIEGSGNGGNVLELTAESENAIVAAPPVQYDVNSVTWSNTARVDHVTYENGRGPVNIKVIDPLNVPEGEFALRFLNNPSSAWIVATNNTTNWVLQQTSPVVRSWTADTTITIRSTYQNEQIIPEIGMSVTIAQVQEPGAQRNPDNNSFLGSTMVFADPTKDWLTGVVDDDSHSATNWIRSGTYQETGTDPCTGLFDDRYASSDPIDPEQVYENVIGGTWAPYRLASAIPTSNTAACYSAGVALNDVSTTLFNRFENVSSVNVVFTNDRSKWTRVPVFEVGPNASLNQGQTANMKLRSAPSVDKYGNTGNLGGGIDNSDFINPTGMSWFPGYAVNLETGERLNMAFGENSGLVGERGRDMLWNPTAHQNSTFGDPLFGGQHYIYVFGHNSNATYLPSSGVLANSLKGVPAYDYGAAIVRIITLGGTNDRQWVFRDAMWVNIPMLSPDFADWNFNYASPGASVIPTETRVHLRVAKPYKRTLTAVVPTPQIPVIANDTVASPVNNNNPMYTFNTYDLKVATNDAASAKDALELINVVPNPYYAYSGYETSQLENKIKFTNLPEKCTIRIYTVSGTLIRKLTKDSPQTSLDWDLNNQAGIPIASGLYIIHVDVPNVGERILKWFGVIRPLDLDAY
jgi:hypothetical protein